MSKHPLRPRRIVRDALDGMPHEKFARIVGLFNAIVPAECKIRKDGLFVNPLTQEFHSLRSFIESKIAANDLAFQREDMGDYVHNLNLLLGELLPPTTLESALPALRDEYRSRVGADVYSAYLTSPAYKSLETCDHMPSPEAKLRLLRADYLQLVNEIRRATLLEYHVEETRSFLIRKLRRTLCKLLIAPLAIVLVFVVCRAAIIGVEKSAAASAPSAFTLNGPGDPGILRLYPSPEAAAQAAPPVTKPEPASAWNRMISYYLVGTKVGEWTTIYKGLVMLALLSLAAIAGAIGSFISALLRIEAVPETTEIARSVVTLRYSESIRLAPVTGLIFSILLSFVFGGKLLNGNLFPNVAENQAWPFVLFLPSELAKWLVWSFIVGFSERLMPDMIDRLIARSGKGEETRAPASFGRTMTAPLGPDINGTNGAGPNGGKPPRSPRHRVKRPKSRRRLAAAAA
jgi:hypothetical protein